MLPWCGCYLEEAQKTKEACVSNEKFARLNWKKKIEFNMFWRQLNGVNNRGGSGLCHVNK
jgi:hypothetical protein